MDTRHDTTIERLYGHQAGAEVGYNPTKPGRPSHTRHPYWIGNRRLVLDVEVHGGKANAAKHSLPRLCQLIERLTLHEGPTLVRGDNAFGNDGVMVALEGLEQRYLFKLRQTAGVKRLIERPWPPGEWQDVGQGCGAVASQLRLSGWRRARRVVVLRRRATECLSDEINGEDPQQARQFLDSSDQVKRWEYAVLVTDTDYGMETIVCMLSHKKTRKSGLHLKQPKRTASGGTGSWAIFVITTTGARPCHWEPSSSLS